MDATAGTAATGGGPDPAGAQRGGPLAGGGGPVPAGTQCGVPLGAGEVAGVLTVTAVPDPLDVRPSTLGAELAEAGPAIHRPAARPTPASDTAPITRRFLLSIATSYPFIS